MRSLLRRAVELAVGLLKELGDESAYSRHLAAHGSRHSAAEWRAFQNQRLTAKYSKAKCC